MDNRSISEVESELDQVKQKLSTTEDTVAYLSDKMMTYRYRWLEEYYRADNLKHHMPSDVCLPIIPQIAEGAPSPGLSPEFLEWDLEDEQPALPVRMGFCTPLNIFGLVRQCFSKLPSHNPEEYVTITDLSFIQGSHQANNEPPSPVTSNSDSQYLPYPNRSSFKLGDWYWNQGVQKSQGDYKKLMDILGSSTFKATDISSTNWKKINAQLGLNDYDKGDEEEWEDKDAGWKRSPVSIKVLFSCTTEVPGPRFIMQRIYIIAPL
ncbi:uncharacterized protein HD556DRAFT_1438212 [Suillus plorans]|uniref:Uncharacterized protein n=1 Tax=Suillus plorans TaxID=116603 RepID=A0A9P7DSQ1_9AGAM|nr:uncharacterized protein HD556DRAFT_1438212 [Suillus plorans]KAG1802175.1 hypothetical protein HD556DRAFT_1438212 [Suillus plorans]